MTCQLIWIQSSGPQLYKSLVASRRLSWFLCQTHLPYCICSFTVAPLCAHAWCCVNGICNIIHLVWLMKIEWPAAAAVPDVISLTLSVLYICYSVELGLQQRIEYLSRAAVCAKSLTSHVLAPGDGKFLHELEDKMEVNYLLLDNCCVALLVMTITVRLMKIEWSTTIHPTVISSFLSPSRLEELWISCRRLTWSKTHQLCNRRHQGDHVPFLTAFCSPPKGKRGYLPSHLCQLRNTIVITAFCLQYCMLCAGGWKIIIIW